MTDLTGVDIRALLKLDNPDLRAALEAMLPKPTYPEHMLGLWAQHPEYGRVLVTYDHPNEDGYVMVSVRMAENPHGAVHKVATVSNLTFPHQVTKGELPTETMYNVLYWGSGSLVIHDWEDGQAVCIDDEEIAQLAYAMLAYAGEPQSTPELVETEEECAEFPEQTTKPEDVPAGEAWLVDVRDGYCSYTRVVALKLEDGEWRTIGAQTPDECVWTANEVTLISPLVPATPAPEPEHPRKLSSLEDYEAAPVGTVVASSGENVWVKTRGDRWLGSWSAELITNVSMADDLPTGVLRWGWGNE